MSTAIHRFSRVDGSLYDWNELRDEAYGWNGILIGNGASINVWERFNYGSIFSQATLPTAQHPLNTSDIRLFTSLNTSNFEQVLSSLKTASLINRALHLDDRRIVTRYHSIEQSLISTIGDVHVPWRIVPDEVLIRIRSELLNYRYVFTTNYDLLIYWAIMHQDPAPFFIDYFFAEEFDISNTRIFDSSKTRVLYLHGALHLYRFPTGTTIKRRAVFGRNLLELFGQPNNTDAIPLVVSGGSSDEKLSTINRSDYLSFAFNTFSEYSDPLVIFGHSLNETDLHIVNALANSRDRRIAVSMLPDTPARIRRAQASMVVKLPEAHLYFFDATTHPLGSADQKIIL